MATKGYAAVAQQCADIIEDARKGVFKSVYLLMGEEPYYPDLVCKAIMEYALQEWERDFNETVFYGADADAEKVITAARRFPMMAERQVVVVKEAQAMKELEQLAIYCENPLPETVFVICLHGAKADKRRALYKNALKYGVVVESPLLKDYELPGWISSYYRSLSLDIDPEAASLLAEAAGTDLSRIAAETEKLLKNLPVGTKTVSAADIERNVGISREFSVFELTRQLSMKNAPAALRTTFFIGSAPRFVLAMSVGALFTHFQRILRYEALLEKDRHPSQEDKARVLGVSPFFFREYDAAVANYPMRKCMAVISLLAEYDYRSKGGDGGEATQGELLTELVTKILNI